MENRDRLPGDERSGWTFVSAGRSPGPWILTAWRGEVLLSRPTLMVVPDALVIEASAASMTVGVPEPHFNASRTARASTSDSPSATDAGRDSVLSLSTLVEDDKEEIQLLQSIVELPERNERQRLMRAAIRRLAKDASHPDWGFAQGFLDSMKLFPADSYEFNRAAFEHPEATALVMLRGAFLGQTEHLWSGF